MIWETLREEAPSAQPHTRCRCSSRGCFKVLILLPTTTHPCSLCKTDKLTGSLGWHLVELDPFNLRTVYKEGVEVEGYRHCLVTSSPSLPHTSREFLQYPFPLTQGLLISCILPARGLLVNKCTPQFLWVDFESCRLRFPCCWHCMDMSSQAPEAMAPTKSQTSSKPLLDKWLINSEIKLLNTVS